MSYVSVDVYVVENTPLKTPVSGVTVRIFDEENKQFFTQDVTDDSGRAGFTLWSQKYSLRFFKQGVQVKQPQIIEVLEDELLNAFEVKATVFQHPIATDSRLCRASGFFRDVTGAPDAGVDMFFIGRFDPILLEGAGVLCERRSTRTDEEGFACIDLIRCARYSVIVQGHEDQERLIEVPDLSSVNLPDLLFPVVDHVSFDLETVSLSVGQVLTLTPVILASNGVPLTGTGLGDVVWSSSNESVLSVAPTATTLVLTGRAVGSANLQAARLNTSIVRIPNTPIQGVPRTFTVS